MKIDYTLTPGRKLNKNEFNIENIKPIVSIITPCYNADKYIYETANSILNQTFPYFEWIIIDDASTNKKTKEYLKDIAKLDSRIKVYNKSNEGAAAARDYGVKKSSKETKYLFFLDTDDLINNTVLECAYLTLETNKEATWCYTDTVCFGEREFVWRKWYDPIFQMQENLVIISSMVKKDAFLSVGGFELREKFVYEDWCLWLKLMKNGMYPVRMSYIGFWYRQKKDNESELQQTSGNNKKRAMELVDDIKKDITEPIKGIQYPKQDYNWQLIPTDFDNILKPIKKINQKIKILFIIPWMVVGGSDKFNLDLVSKLDKDKFEIVIITTEPDKNPWRQEFEEHATVYDLTTFLDKKYWLAFIKYVIEINNINIIFNSNSTFGYNALPFIKGNFPDKPIVDYIHMEEWYNRNGGFSRDSSAVASVIDKTLVCNNKSEEILIEYFERKKEDIGTVYIGVDEKKYNPKQYNKEEILKEFEILNDKKYVIGFLARIAEQKRPHLLMKIIKELSKKRNDFKVIIAGDGPMLDSIKSEASKYKLNDKVVFLGNLKETEKLYAISDLTLNCSIKEGLALTSYESLSMGVPVISSDVGGQKELINDEVGVIVPCMQEETEIFNFSYTDEEINNYIVCIEKILNDLDKYKKNCRKRIVEKFTIDKMIHNMEEIFIDISINPNSKKSIYAKGLKVYEDLSKELVSKYFVSFAEEYDWIAEDFNKNYIGNDYTNFMNKTSINFKTKLKIFIVRVLKKLNLYDFSRKILKGE